MVYRHNTHHTEREIENINYSHEYMLLTMMNEYMEKWVSKKTEWWKTEVCYQLNDGLIGLWIRDNIQFCSGCFNWYVWFSCVWADLWYLWDVI